MLNHDKLQLMYENYLDDFEENNDRYNLDYDEDNVSLTYEEFIDEYIGQH